MPWSQVAFNLYHTMHLDDSSDIYPSVDNSNKAIFLGACFGFMCAASCSDSPLGVIDAVSGYMVL